MKLIILFFFFYFKKISLLECQVLCSNVVVLKTSSHYYQTAILKRVLYPPASVHIFIMMMNFGPQINQGKNLMMLTRMKCTISLWKQLGTPLCWEPLLSHMHPNPISRLKNHLLTSFVGLSSILFSSLFYVLSCSLMQLLDKFSFLFTIHTSTLINR